MANVLAVTIPITRAPQVNRELRNNDSSFGKLDVVLNSELNGSGGNRQNSLKKIASFSPTQLKNLTANIDKTVSRREQTSEIRLAEQTLTKDKIKSLRGQNISDNKSPKEAQVGSKIDLSA